ncbi:MAB_1171c family putative transporter [Streptomyces goshikiensis]|uniref:MAB_1171c family putative transporter n=1 Tax=Streptomyces goshikiensis TaxID=1942 RepID=UPI0036775E12
MSNSDYYLPALAFLIAFAARVPSLIRGWRDPLVRSMCALIAMAGSGFFFAAPPTITRVNKLTGIDNFSAPFVYCILCAFSASSLLLIIAWRGGDNSRRLARRWILSYSAVIIALPVLFSLGEAPVERLRDLDTYYANTFGVREMIVVYLISHITAAIATTLMCWRWAREIEPTTPFTTWLRRGLRILVIGFLANLAFGLIKLAAVIAAWASIDWSVLSTTVAPPLVSLGGVIVTVGFLVPLLGPRADAVWTAWITYVRLGPLWQAVKPADGRGRLAVRTRLWMRPELRLIHRRTDIKDWIRTLRQGGFLDDSVRQAARAAADARLNSCITGERREELTMAAGVAAMLAAAAQARTADNPPDPHLAELGAEAIDQALQTPQFLVDISCAIRAPYVVGTKVPASTGSPS